MNYYEFKKQFQGSEDFKRAYGALSYDEAKAIVAAGNYSDYTQESMLKEWKICHLDACLSNFDVHVHGGGEVIIKFYEFDSEFDGNDFEYTYYLNDINGKKLVSMIPKKWNDPVIDLKQWICDNINCEGTGYDLRSKWTEMGLHGIRTVHEDYPGGIHRVEEF